MEDWSKDFWKTLDTVTTEFEQFFEDLGEMVEMIADEVNATILTEIDQLLEELFDPVIELYTDFDFEYDSGEMESSITYKVEPSLERHSACMGCKHYHGYVYGGNLLVCGMYPSGWEGESCPDWEGGQAKPPYNDNHFF